jgi:hypothetical protein
MQGAFPDAGQHLDANWAEVFNPNPGEDAAAAYRERRDEANLNRVREARRAAADGGAPPPAVVPLPDTPKPIAPSVNFRIKGKSFFLLDNRINTAAPLTNPRDGMLGHYLVAYEEFTETLPDGTQVPRAKPYTAGPDTPNATPEVVPPHAPGAEQTDPRPKPSGTYCQVGRDYICANTPGGPLFFEIGTATLQKALEEAESRDLAFARRMEGLGNVSRAVVWDCLDPDYDPMDRRAVMHQFMTKYLDRFYTRMTPGNVPDVGELSEEALYKHKRFCREWVLKHYRTLTPAVTAPAEALAAQFFPFLEPQFPRQNRLSRAELARILMRHEDFAAEFATCLHYFSTSLEQGRGGRNASYRQISQTAAAKSASYNRLGNLLGERSATLSAVFRQLRDPLTATFHVLLVDWYGILGQIPQVHRYFDDDAAMHAGRGATARARAGGGDGQVPPWRASRAS